MAGMHECTDVLLLRGPVPTTTPQPRDAHRHCAGLHPLVGLALPTGDALHRAEPAWGALWPALTFDPSRDGSDLGSSPSKAGLDLVKLLPAQMRASVGWRAVVWR